MEAKQKQFSELIKELRSAKGFSLRQVEKKSGISNAYLSQLENGKIEKPSPHILYKLAEVYEVSYENLMKLAGYIKKKDNENIEDNVINKVAFLAIDSLTPEEKKDVIDYINYLRSKRRK